MTRLARTYWWDSADLLLQCRNRLFDSTSAPEVRGNAPIPRTPPLAPRSRSPLPRPPLLAPLVTSPRHPSRQIDPVTKLGKATLRYLAAKGERGAFDLNGFCPRRGQDTGGGWAFTKWPQSWCGTTVPGQCDIDAANGILGPSKATNNHPTAWGDGTTGPCIVTPVSR